MLLQTNHKSFWLVLLSFSTTVFSTQLLVCTLNLLTPLKLQSVFHYYLQCSFYYYKSYVIAFLLLT